MNILHFNDTYHIIDNLKIIPLKHAPSYTEEEGKLRDKY